MTKEISRREFVKQTAVGAVMAAGALDAVAAAAAGPSNPNKQVAAALGSMLIPSKPGDPGYIELEPFGITEYVMQEKFPVEGLAAFNGAAQKFFDGKAFLELDEKQRGDYLSLVADGSKIDDADQRKNLQAFYRGARTRILQVYYRNFPFQEIKRNAAGEPILHPGDTHQIINPNVWKDKKVVTGWDVAGYVGQPGWEEEEKLRAESKKTSAHWWEGATAKLESSRSPAATAIKTSDGHDYFDVIVLGGGTAGCVVAGRLAERGMNPKTGDRLRVAMIEGGDDWTIHDPGLNPGYGNPIRRRMSNIPDDKWDYPLAEGDVNMKRLGGCVLHYGGTLWMPGYEDFHFYRDTSGVDWDEAKFGSALQEVSDLMYLNATPQEWWSKADNIWADAGRSLGFEMHANQRAFRNAWGGSDGANRYDCKGNTLPWAYLGLNNGLKVIANAEVEKILIEKVPGGRPVAIGAVYKDKTGTMREVRAARVILAAGVVWGPMLLYRSGYGPKDYLGDKLIVQNENVGRNLSADCDFVSNAYLAEPVNLEGRAADIPNETVWAATKPRPWGELDIRFHSGSPGREPGGAALNPFAPESGWDHKEFMRNGTGVKHLMSWRCHIGANSWTWRVQPDAFVVRTSIDKARFEATVKQGLDMVRAWHEKLAVKVVKADLRTFARPTDSVRPQHMTGTTRAGSSPENSVCTSDFDCHDIDHLLLTSGSTIPKTFYWSAGPVAATACYGWRRMIANHFSTGSSTKGFA